MELYKLGNVHTCNNSGIYAHLSLVTLEDFYEIWIGCKMYSYFLYTLCLTHLSLQETGTFSKNFHCEWTQNVHRTHAHYLQTHLSFCFISYFIADGRRMGSHSNRLLWLTFQLHNLPRSHYYLFTDDNRLWSDDTLQCGTYVQHCHKPHISIYRTSQSPRNSTKHCYCLRNEELSEYILQQSITHTCSEFPTYFGPCRTFLRETYISMHEETVTSGATVSSCTCLSEDGPVWTKTCLKCWTNR
jgi:hypothetical protein